MDEVTLIEAINMALAHEMAVDRYATTDAAPATSMFDHLYATLPATLAGQRGEVAGQGTGHG